MKRLFIVIPVVAVFALSCGQADRTTDLDQMLSEIPSELASDSILWFTNMEKIRELAGVDPGTGVNEYVNKETEIEVYRLRMDLLAGYTMSYFSGGMHMERWRDAFGFDAFATSREIWVSRQEEPRGTRPLFSVMKGDFAKNNIIEKLDNLGYQLKNYASIDYYSIRADNQVDIKSAGVARMAMAFLNRMTVTESEIIAAPADDIFFPLLDVRSGNENSLEDSLAYTRVAAALGDVLGAALIPPSQLRSENVNTDWDNLHTYDLAGIGYLVEGQDLKVLIALHYPDDSAANDIDELNRRLAEYVITTGGLETPLLSALFDIGDPEAITYKSDSILKIELVYKLDTPNTLWSALVESRDLGFLVSSPSG